MVPFNIWRTEHYPPTPLSNCTQTIDICLSFFFHTPASSLNSVNDISTWQHTMTSDANKQTRPSLLYCHHKCRKVWHSLVDMIGYKHLFSFAVWSACHHVLWDTLSEQCGHVLNNKTPRTISKMGLWNRRHCSLLSLLIC